MDVQILGLVWQGVKVSQYLGYTRYLFFVLLCKQSLAFIRQFSRSRENSSFVLFLHSASAETDLKNGPPSDQNCTEVHPGQRFC